jgi:hypothetical protein
MTNIITGCFFLVSSVVVWIASSHFTKRPVEEAFGAGFLPGLIAIVLGVLSIVLIIRGVAEYKKVKDPSSVNKSETASIKEKIELLKTPLFVSVSIMVYLLILEYIGFLISTPLLLFATTKIMGAKTKNSIITAIILTLVTVIIFQFALRIPLPRGKIF